MAVGETTDDTERSKFMANIILMVCGVLLILNAGVLVCLNIQLAKEVPELILERAAATVVALLAVGAGVFFIASV